MEKCPEDNNNNNEEKMEQMTHTNFLINEICKQCLSHKSAIQSNKLRSRCKTIVLPPTLFDFFFFFAYQLIAFILYFVNKLLAIQTYEMFVQHLYEHHMHAR